MVDYLTDLDVTQALDIRKDASNDLATTSGVENLRQGIALTTMGVTRERIGNKATADQLGLLEERVESMLDDDPHVGDVLRVTTETFNRNQNVVTMQVTLTDGEFMLPVNIGEGDT
jgi:hypothetical protein